MPRLEGKVAIVTGAARGTGEQTARLFAEEGARVVIADILEEEGRGTAEEIGDAATFERLDVTDVESWRHVVARTSEAFGPPTVLVNNAGLLHMKALVDIDPADVERLWRVNQFGPFLGMQAVAPAMKSAGGGSIVNVSSVDGLSAKNGLGAYVPTKWALRGLTRVAALELGQMGIRVNVVCPEAGGPGMRREFTPESIDPMDTLSFTHDAIPHNQMRPGLEIIRDIARMILFLASDESLSCTGADYPVDAGWTAGRRLKFNPGYSAE
ncbi:MAG: SDR family oxidoreductase [bacterium]|nr:3-alpha-hydroxysteroid dehydrogenase [Deltaproteobacteria bacterium]MCP4905468.1 SDR family oxidoreductase [bacterium]